MSGRPDEHPKRDLWLERAITLVSGVVIAAAVGGLFYLDPPTGPATLDVGARIEKSYHEGARLVVPFRIENRGSEPVAEVHVEVSLEGTESKFETTIGHLGRGMTLRGLAFFEGAPDDAAASARIVGFQFP